MFQRITAKLCPFHGKIVSEYQSCINVSKRRITMSSAEVRSTFIDYFVRNHNHTFVKSSSIIPKNDPSLITVNAGMNQFKDIFLDTLYPVHPFKELKRVANSQKCIRCGGKHNDLKSVGYDLRHHTFFEMLGNWSFSDYYKKEAIEWSWDLLTKVFRLDIDRLFVTYFEGDESLGVEKDVETKEIWSSLGLSEERIIPLAASENFWEMAKTGPCGPCSEIHYLLEPNVDLSRVSRRELMEKLSLEIWNLVFIQYNRKGESELVPLSNKFVDTGMGLERIVSVVQGKSHSNYETDLFLPLFEYIRKETGRKPYSGSLTDPIDIAYRITADHMRMATIAISDGLMPDGRGAGHKVRGVIRSAYWQVKYTMAHHQVRDVLCQLPQLIAESLSPAYPEVNERLPIITGQIDKEVDLFKDQIQRSKKIFKQMSRKYRRDPGQVMSGQMMSGQVMSGQMMSGQVMSGQMMSGQEAYFFLRQFGAPVELLKLYSSRYDVMIDYDQLNNWIEKYNS